jgi:hypothetical protein
MIWLDLSSSPVLYNIAVVSEVAHKAVTSAAPFGSIASGDGDDGAPRESERAPRRIVAADVASRRFPT